ncbi:MAG: hypothetical protein IJN40_02510 [Clostridia bacterium]|nr:hypothetical protein [Clostridia bacterium]
MEKIMNFWNSLSTKGKIAVAIVAFCVAGPFGLIAIALSHWSTIRTRLKVLKKGFFFVVAFAIPRITKSIPHEKYLYSRL